MTQQTQQSVIHGTQYNWEERTQAHSTALLWRTIRDTDTIEQVSGSILCLGELHNKTAQALLFQNSEGPLIATDHVQTSQDEDSPSFKGGFLLPQEIRNSKIITASCVQPANFCTPQKSRGSGLPVRRNHVTE